MKKAVIYCRVSSDKQAREGHGLEGQEKRCRDFAFYNEFEIEAVFKDQAVSGGLIDRPGIQALLDYVIEHGDGYAIIVDDINRFARDVVAHFTLKKAIKDAKSDLFCVNMKLEDNPEGHFIETIMAASTELERNRNKRQVCNRMKARLELGYWVFDAPPGYKYVKDAVHGKILVLDEPKASIVREAIEGFASGIFLMQQDVQAFLTEKKFTHRGKFKKVHLVQVKRILTRPLYAGLIQYPDWDIKPIQGKHEGIVSVEVFKKVQEKLFGRAKKTFTKKVVHEDFPVRGFVLCSGCEKPLTASWSKGRTQKYPYYRCNNKACSCAQKSIKKDVLEGAFAQALKSVTPAKQILELAKAITLDVYNKKQLQRDVQAISLQNKREHLEKQIKAATDRLIATTSPAVQAALEKQIEDFESQRHHLEVSLRKMSTNIDFGTRFTGSDEIHWKPA